MEYSPDWKSVLVIPLGAFRLSWGTDSVRPLNSACVSTFILLFVAAPALFYSTLNQPRVTAPVTCAAHLLARSPLWKRSWSQWVFCFNKGWWTNKCSHGCSTQTTPFLFHLTTEHFASSLLNVDLWTTMLACARDFCQSSADTRGFFSTTLSILLSVLTGRPHRGRAATVLIFLHL